MGELLGALRRLLGHADRPATRRGLGLDPLDRERARSMADEGGAAGAEVEAQPAEWRRTGDDGPKPSSRGG